MADEPKSEPKNRRSSAKAETAETTEPSAADLELHGASPTPGTTTYPAPPEEVPDDAAEPVAVTVTVGDEEVEIDSDLRGTIIARAAATQASHPAHQSPDYSNPALRERTEEEIEADQEEYASRFG